MTRDFECCHKYKLVMSPSTELFKKGIHITQIYTDVETVKTIYKASVAKGMVCFLTAVRIQEVRFDCNDFELAKFLEVE